MSSTAPNNLLFALADCNNFFASCERVFDPSLHGSPLVILSSNDGCIIARSNEAKALGIPMGAPAFQYASLIQQQNVIVRSSNFALYGDMSKRVMRTLAQFTPDIQVYSVDEAFLLLEKENVKEYMQKIRSTVLQWTGIPTSIGAATTKTLAKVANYYAKKYVQKEGVFFLTPALEQPILKSLPVEEIWGIGRRITDFLSRQGIRSAWELRNADDLWIRKHLSVTVLRTVWELRGISCLELEEAPAAKKSIMTSKSFGYPLFDFKEIAEALASYTARAAEKMRGQESSASYLEVFLLSSPSRDEEYYHNAVQMILPQPTDYTPELTHYAKEGLQAIFREKILYKKTGVMLGGLVPKNNYQLDLFMAKNENQEKRDGLMQLIDQTNRQFGRGTLKFAAEGVKQTWKAKKANCSKRYTTQWKEILSIKLK